jgi:methylmalonyl-CoA/ethylmalonyl-CoA epimerase
MDLEHIGIAVADSEAVTTLYEQVFDVPIVHEEVFDGRERLKIRFLDVGGGTYIELLEPLEEGTISAAVEDSGGSLHHLAFETDDIEAALQACREHSVDPIDDEPRPGAWGHEVAFLDPSATGDILVELVE